MRVGSNFTEVKIIQRGQYYLTPFQPYHIDEVSNFHEKNQDADIILPTLKVKTKKNELFLRFNFISPWSKMIKKEFIYIMIHSSEENFLLNGLKTINIKIVIINNSR